MSQVTAKNQEYYATMLTTRPGHSVMFSKRRLFNMGGGEGKTFKYIIFNWYAVNTSCSEYHTARNVILRDFTLKIHNFRTAIRGIRRNLEGFFGFCKWVKTVPSHYFNREFESPDLGRDRIIRITVRAITEAWGVVGLRD
jgi:hypothetical protein